MDSTMEDEPNGKFDWVPLTPAKSIPSRYEYNSAEKRASQPVSILKVCEETKLLRVYKRILRPNECMKNSRKLGPNFPSFFKKARKSQMRRTAFEKFITFLKLNEADELHWLIKRKRSMKKSIIKNDLLSHVNDCSKLQFFENFLNIYSSIKNQLGCVEVQENGYVEVQDGCVEVQENDISVNQFYDFYTEALFDFSIQMIDGLHIDVSKEFSNHMDVLHCDDVSTDFSGWMIGDDVSNQLILWNQNQNGAIVSSEESQPPAKAKMKKSPNAEKAKKSPKAVKKSIEKVDKTKTKKMTMKTEEVDEGQLDKFISAMKLGEGHFLPCEGSVVDYVVGLYLTQKCKTLKLIENESEAFMAFMNLKSRFRVASDGVTDFAIQDTELLSIGHFDEVVPEQLLMVEKEGTTSCPSSSHTDDGNVNSSQTEFTLQERKGKNDNKQDTSGELCVKYTTPKTRTGCNCDSIDWKAVRQTSYSDLAVILMKRGPKILLAGTIKDFLNWMVEDDGSIDLEWLRDIPLEEANEYLLSIPYLGLKKTTDIDRVCGAFVASSSSFPALPSEGP